MNDSMAAIVGAGPARPCLESRHIGRYAVAPGRDSRARRHQRRPRMPGQKELKLIKAHFDSAEKMQLAIQRLASTGMGARILLAEPENDRGGLTMAKPGSDEIN